MCDPEKRKHFVKHVTKKSTKCEARCETKSMEECYVESLKYMQNNMDKVAQEIYKYIKKHKYDKNAPMMISGIALYLARGWVSTPIFPVNKKSINRGFKFPSLPNKFPGKLRQMALKASKYQLEHFNNEQGWREPDRRIQALKNQIKLFSN